MTQALTHSNRNTSQYFPAKNTSVSYLTGHGDLSIAACIVNN